MRPMWQPDRGGHSNYRQRYPDDNTAFYLDGSYDTNVWRFGGNLLPNPDALQEFRVLTSNFDAEFGRSAGGVVKAITRSGTSQYHGLVYDYLRNDIFNAKNWFLTSVTPLRQNQFGGNFGGPIPKLHGSWHFSLLPTRVYESASPPTLPLLHL